MSNKKRVMTVLEFLKENTNQNHPVKTESIVAYLEGQGFKVERKTIYNDVKELNEMGYAVEKCHNGYYYDNELFELSELRFLVDSAKASDVLSQKKTTEICDKLLSLTNKYDRQLIDDGQYVSNKSVNQQVLYNINAIIMAIGQKHAITFKYFDINTDDEKVYRQKNYNVFPYSLVMNNDRYYVICANIKHPDSAASYRLDKMEQVELSKGSKTYEKIPFDIDDYMNSHFSMYNGETKNVVLKCANELYSEVKQKFGDNVIVIEKGEDYFKCNANVIISPTFFSWVFTFMGRIIILSPSDVQQEMVSRCQQMIDCQFDEGNN